MSALDSIRECTVLANIRFWTTALPTWNRDSIYKHFVLGHFEQGDLDSIEFEPGVANLCL